MTYSDIKERIIPDICIIAGILALISVRIFIEKTFTFRIFMDLFAGFSVFWLLRIFSKGKLGMGDVKLSAFLAMLLGIPVWIFSMMIASLSGTILFLAMLIAGRIGKRDSIAFAPFISFGAIIGFFLRPEIIRL
ncbi:MAG: hypothetical protein GXP33_10960 [Spirochaetes bacterium]|nr:hypothetical protein [Spirochaetota bacterium]